MSRAGKAPTQDEQLARLQGVTKNVPAWMYEGGTKPAGVICQSCLADRHVDCKLRSCVCTYSLHNSRRVMK